VSLRVNREPRLEGSRVVTVVPLESEGALRHRDWIERNRRRVDALSKGQVAYVYQPNTSEDSLQEFDRYFFPQSDRAAVIVDERFNRGGGDPDYQLDVLDRQQVHWYRERNAPPFKSPFSIVAGPKVMLVNAEARSGGDVYPYQFKIRGLGTTVGTRTWGGVQGGGAGVPLIDGGFAGVPDLGTYAPDGRYILENTGFVPDVEVQVFPADDAAGRDPQLEKAVEILLEELRRNPPRPVPPLEKVDRSRKTSSP
jgi:tricorn protease